MASNVPDRQGKPSNGRLRGTAAQSRQRMPDQHGTPVQGPQNPRGGGADAGIAKPYGPGHATGGRKTYPHLSS